MAHGQKQKQTQPNQATRYGGPFSALAFCTYHPVFLTPPGGLGKDINYRAPQNVLLCTFFFLEDVRAGNGTWALFSPSMFLFFWGIFAGCFTFYVVADTSCTFWRSTFSFTLVELKLFIRLHTIVPFWIFFLSLFILI